MTNKKECPICGRSIRVDDQFGRFFDHYTVKGVSGKPCNGREVCKGSGILAPKVDKRTMEFEIRVDPKNGKTGAEGYTAGYAPTMAWAWNFARAAIRATGCHVFIVRHHSAQRTAIILANNCDEAFAIRYLE